MKIIKSINFNIRITKTPKGEKYYETVALQSEEMSKILAKSLRTMGYEVTLSRIVTYENVTWDEIKL